MFLVTAPEEVPPTASIKVSDEAFEDLPAKRGFSPAPYMARHKWIKIDDINHWSEKQWESYLKEAYVLVASNLLKKNKTNWVWRVKTLKKSGTPSGKK